MKTRVSRGSLLLLVSSAIAAACGDSGSTTNVPLVDAGADGSSSTDAAVAAKDSGTATDAGNTNDACVDEDGGCLPPTVRRPFLIGSKLRSATATSRTDWMHASMAECAPIDEKTRGFLAAAWLKDALEEHASVAAFARFSMYLLALGAPPDLVARSQRASLDEIVHARGCFDLAARYGRVAVGPSALDLSGAMSGFDLETVARLTAEEGCVGETLGAALAMDQLAAAEDPHVRELMERIAVDEARHADLAWRFAAWAVKMGGKRVYDAIIESAERAIRATLATELRTYDGIDTETLHAHGRLTCAEARESAERTIDEIVRPCLARLASLAPRSSDEETITRADC